MSDNWFVQHPEVMRYILKHEQAAALIGSECDIQDEMIAVPVEDRMIHWEGRPFCDSVECPCHDDAELIAEHLLQPQTAGLLTLDEAASLYYGKQL